MPALQAEASYWVVVMLSGPQAAEAVDSLALAPRLARQAELVAVGSKVVGLVVSRARPVAACEREEPIAAAVVVAADSIVAQLEAQDTVRS